MVRYLSGLAILLSSGAVAASNSTDFGVRAVGSVPREPAVVSSSSGGSGRIDLSAVAGIGAQWGRVTSLRRSPEHNRRVGGVRNSYHLSGRAIDIARRPGVRHADIAAAYRAAGYHLVESLDEGDHSHFAFGTRAAPISKAVSPGEVTAWKMVYAPSGGSQ